MADFKTHWQVGLAASVGGSLISNWAGLASPKLIPILVAVGWVGSIAPDLDSDTGRPLKLIFSGLAVLLPPVLLWRVPWLHESAERAVMFWGLAALLIQGPLKWIFKTFTKHRGVVHSVPAALIFGCVCFVLAYHEAADRRFQVATGFMGALGYLTHLVLDEFWSVDFNGTSIKTKKSFGTALSLRGRSKLQTTLLYLTLGVMGWGCLTLFRDEPFIPKRLVGALHHVSEEVEKAEPMSGAWWRELLGVSSR